MHLYQERTGYACMNSYGLRLDTEEQAFHEVFCMGCWCYLFYNLTQTLGRSESPTHVTDCNMDSKQDLALRVLTFMFTGHWSSLLNDYLSLRKDGVLVLISLHGLNVFPRIWVNFEHYFLITQNLFEICLCSASRCFSKVGSAVFKTISCWCWAVMLWCPHWKF